MKKVGTAILFMMAVLLAASCSKDSSTKLKEAQTLIDQAYGASAQQVADVYIPKGGGQGYGAVILIHGGAWIAGDKTDFGSSPSMLSAEGYVVVNMNYRLADPSYVVTPTLNTITITQMLDDVDAVKAYVRNNAADWDCNPDKIALIGASAGAHLALMDTLTKNGSETIKACVSFSGPTDFTDTGFHTNNFPYNGTQFKVLDGLQLVVAKKWDSEPGNPAFVAASPVSQNLTQVAGTRILIVHGQNDSIVPFSQVQVFYNTLVAGSIAAEKYWSPYDDHDLKYCIQTVTTNNVIPLLASTLR